jgi:predicted O-methyltransferase YrrM
MKDLQELNTLLTDNKDSLKSFYHKGWNSLDLFGTTAKAVKTFEAQCVYSIVKHLKATEILEVGTGLGFSTLYLAQAIHELEGRTLHSIDLLDISIKRAQVLFQKTNNLKALEKVKFHSGASEEVLPSFENNLDFALIDGSHSYEDVKSDFLKLYPKVKKGGAIAFHDVQTTLGLGPGKLWKELLNKQLLKDEGFTLIQLDRSTHKIFNYYSDIIEIQRLQSKWKQHKMSPEGTDPCTCMGILFK